MDLGIEYHDIVVAMEVGQSLCINLVITYQEYQLLYMGMVLRRSNFSFKWFLGLQK